MRPCLKKKKKKKKDGLHHSATDHMQGFLRLCPHSLSIRTLRINTGFSVRINTGFCLQPARTLTLLNSTDVDTSLVVYRGTRNQNGESEQLVSQL